MRKWNKLAVFVAFTLVSACTDASSGSGDPVPKKDFDDFKKSVQDRQGGVKKDGEAVDLWISQAQGVLEWVSKNGANFTCSPACSDPPPPPTPVPDGEW